VGVRGVRRCWGGAMYVCVCACTKCGWWMANKLAGERAARKKTEKGIEGYGDGKGGGLIWVLGGVSWPYLSRMSISISQIDLRSQQPTATRLLICAINMQYMHAPTRLRLGLNLLCGADPRTLVPNGVR
jgi:hypothetical protein